jgi:hypothetical protein
MAQRGRPPKMRQLELPTLENSNQGENVMAEDFPIKHVVRGINKKGMFGTEGDMPVEAVEQTLAQYVDAGYKLKEVYMIGNTPDLINLLYIFVKE